jgi:2-dehydropantoate 2-reductase
MAKKYTIAILGIGGVGGFIGGKLAEAYSNSKNVEVIFVSRGSNAQAIKEKGLRLVTAQGETTVRPDDVVVDPGAIGEIDILIVCTKAYDLEKSISSLSSSITPETVILPLLNGVESTEVLQSLQPEARVLYGCIYLVSKLMAPGVVQQRGEYYSLHFGGDKKTAPDTALLLRLLEKANINAVLEENIRDKVWSKFSFISPVATYTAGNKISIGKILESEEHTAALKKLMTEFAAVAKALNVHLPADTIERNFLVMEKLPRETTSSMEADFANNRLTELETLTGFVVRKAKEQGIPLELYTDMYHRLRVRQNSY